MNQLETIVHDTVSELIGKQELFTALDVTNAVRQGGGNRPAFPCRHREVRDVVKQAFGSGQLTSYDRQNINVRTANGAVETSWLYHPNNLTQQDIDNQYPDSRRGISATPSPSVIQAVLGTSSAKGMVTRPKMLAHLLATRVQAAGQALLGTGSDD